METNLTINNLQAQLERIEQNYLLASKTMLTFDDVTTLTGLSKSTLYKMTSRRELPHYKPNGKLTFFKKSEIEEWMAQNRVNTTQEAEQFATAYIHKRRVAI